MTIKFNFDDRMNQFITEVHAVARAMEPTPPAQLIDEFVDYWTEHNVNGRKMRFEKQKTFNTGRRLRTWVNNDRKWNKGNSSNSANSTDLNSLLYGQGK